MANQVPSTSTNSNASSNPGIFPISNLNDNFPLEIPPLIENWIR